MSAAVSGCAPWIQDLNEEEHTAVDEIIARLLENEISSRFDPSSHTLEEHISELAMYSIRISSGQFAHLCSEWNRKYWSERDLAGMAGYIHGFLFNE